MPAFQANWNARRGAQQLAQAYARSHLTFEDFNGPRYVRLAQLKRLVERGLLDETMRWRS